MISLSETAKLIWENFETTDSIDDIIKLITDFYEIDDKTARVDAIQFIAEMLKAGFIELTKEDKSW